MTLFNNILVVITSKRVDAGEPPSWGLLLVEEGDLVLSSLPAVPPKPGDYSLSFWVNIPPLWGGPCLAGWVAAQGELRGWGQQAGGSAASCNLPLPADSSKAANVLR